MKKTTTIVLALVLALSMFASFAFVINPGTGSAGEKKTGIQIVGFHATDDAALLKGPRLYTELANTSESGRAYAKNEIIRFAVKFDVLNPLVISNNADVAKATVLDFTSSTVDLSVARYAGNIALIKPFGNALINAVNVDFNGSTTAGAMYSKVAGKHVLSVKVDVDAAVIPEESSIEADGIKVGTKFSGIALSKASFAYIFTGITQNEVTEKGLVTLGTTMTGGAAFNTNKLLSTVKNGRTYLIERVEVPVTDITDVMHPARNTNADAKSTLDPTYYTLKKVGYRVYLAKKNSSGEYDITPVAQLDTESVKYSDLYEDTDLEGLEAEGLGFSLGLEELTVPSNTTVTDLENTAPNATQKMIVSSVLYDGTVRYLYSADGTEAFKVGSTERVNLENMLADFGLSTASGYTYKLEDKAFTADGAYAQTATANYNNGTVTPVEPEEEGDLDEGTGEEELPEEGDIDEDLDEDGDITDEEEEEVPAETGDFSASIAIALAAAAIVAAAALTVVMKKARD